MSHALSAQGRRTLQPPISWLMDLTLGNPGLISLAAGFTDNASLPVERASELLREILAQPMEGQSALQYGSTQGDPRLRQLTAQHLAQLDRLESLDAERLLITHGSQQLLYIVSEVLCDQGDIVLVEDPTYFVFLGIAQSRGIDCRGVKLERQGIDIGALEQTLERLRKSGEIRRLKALYLVSYFQNPTGRTTIATRKREALKLLRQYEKSAGHPIYLIEDAAYRELRFAGDDVPSALSLPGGASRVIYAGTFSKPFATGARVGYGLMPPEIFEAALRVKGNHDFGTANLLQRLLSRALESGEYHRHVASLRERYTRKAGVLADALREHFPEGLEWDPPQGGLYIWAGLASRRSCGRDSAIFRKALKAGMLYVPGEICYAGKGRSRPAHEMRLSFGGAVLETIPEGIRRLARAVKPDSSRRKD